ncbi:hypothetical protein LTR85_010877 [Meristemomyces frigidus]|nr:hypothetical protein LTR85_010877 [Meristemomyces frigidus]
MSPASNNPPNRNALQSASTQQGKPKSKTKYVCRATQITPLLNRLLPGEPVFLDIEFQKYRIAGEEKERHRIGRIATLNSVGQAALDVYAVYPKEDGIQKRWQPARFGVITKDLLFENGAQPADKVERWVAEIVKDRTVVMHGGTHDRTAFFYEKDIFASSTIVDTQNLYGQVKLLVLASRHLGKAIQEDDHSPVEDADATRELYLRLRPYDRAAELAEVQAERAAAAPAQQHQIRVKDTNTTTMAAIKNRTNLSGSAKRRNRNKAAAAQATAAGNTTTGPKTQVAVTVTKHVHK